MSNGLASTAALTTLTIPWSFILAWMYYGSGRSLVPCILTHGAGNAWASFFAVVFPIPALRRLAQAGTPVIDGSPASPMEAST